MGNTTANVASVILLVAVAGGMAAWAGVTPADVGFSTGETPTPVPTATPTATPTPTPTPKPTPARDPDDPGASSHTYENGFTLESDTLEQAVFEETNRVRNEQRSGTVEKDPVIASVARAHGEDMSSRNYISHNNLEGESFTDRYWDVRPGQCQNVGENIFEIPAANIVYSNYTTVRGLAKRAVHDWWESPGHKRTMLDDRYDRLGVGAHVGSDGDVYLTQDFCESY